MSDKNKKKFNFFDLSDDNSFPDFSYGKEEIKSNESKNIQINNSESLYPKVEKFAPTNIFENNKMEPIEKVSEVVINKNEYNQNENKKKENYIQENKAVNQEKQNVVLDKKENNNYQTNIQEYNITNKKISDLFEVKEKLDVKTNIYIKKWIYEEIEKIHFSTNKSRSSVINTLLEHALKNLNNN